MALNGNRFKQPPGKAPCPECHGYPPLKVENNRFVPKCDTCGGGGWVERASVLNVKPEDE